MWRSSKPWRGNLYGDNFLFFFFPLVVPFPQKATSFGGYYRQLILWKRPSYLSSQRKHRMGPEYLESNEEILEGLELPKGAFSFYIETHLNLTVDHEPCMLAIMKWDRLRELSCDMTTPCESKDKFIVSLTWLLEK